MKNIHKNTNLNNKFGRIILFSSLNGGTGKSYIISHISKLLATKNKIGLLDIDINSICLTQHLQLQNKRLESITDSHGHTLVQPHNLNGIKFVSAGLLDIGSDLTGLRGGQLSGISRLLISEVNWDELDYLLIDLPSGLSDIELTILDDFPNSEILMISSGNIFADKRKLQYYSNRNIKILGLLYNRQNINLNLEDDCIDFCRTNNVKYLGIFSDTFNFLNS
jgi:ATP-binding protein involved in chromosome partitioning